MFSLVGIVLRKYLFVDLYLHSFSDNPDHFVTLSSPQQMFSFILLLYRVNIFYYLR